MLKIKTKVLTGFLKKVQMDGDNKIKEVLLRFEKDGLKANVQASNSEKTTAGIMAWLKTSAFKDYEEIGNIGVDDLPAIIKIIERFDEFITLAVKGNLLTVSGENKKVDIELVAENFIKKTNDLPNLKFVDTFEMHSLKLKSIFEDAKTENEDVTINIKTEAKAIKVSNTGKYKFLTSFDEPKCVGGAKRSFGSPLVDSVKNLDGQLEISVGENFPMRIMETTEISVITMLIAPRVDE